MRVVSEFQRFPRVHDGVGREGGHAIRFDSFLKADFLRERVDKPWPTPRLLSDRGQLLFGEYVTGLIRVLARQRVSASVKSPRRSDLDLTLEALPPSTTFHSGDLGIRLSRASRAPQRSTLCVTLFGRLS